MEGGEGVGKSTNLAFLEKFLAVITGVERCLYQRARRYTHVGEEIRKMLLQVRQEKVSAMTELLLIFAARAQHVSELIEPALAMGQVVLCDRFTDATYAYQCGGRGVAWDTVEQLEELVQDKLRPDVTLLLDAPTSVGMSRARGQRRIGSI